MFCSPHREVWVDGIFLDSSPTRIPHERSECGVKGGRHSIKDMVRIVFAFREFQQFDKFLFVCLVFVMFPLIADIFFYRAQLSRADAESSIPNLPRKIFDAIRLLSIAMSSI